VAVAYSTACVDRLTMGAGAGWATAHPGNTYVVWKLLGNNLSMKV